MVSHLKFYFTCQVLDDPAEDNLYLGMYSEHVALVIALNASLLCDTIVPPRTMLLEWNYSRTPLSLSSNQVKNQTGLPGTT